MKEIEIYKTKEGQTQIEVKFDNDTLWLNQKQIAEIFGTEVPAINKHIKNILKEKELQQKSTVSKMEIVQKEGKRQVNREVEFYSLDMVISVGYRVSSRKATQFRIWATQRLKEHLIKGYTLNEKRLKHYAQNLRELEQTVKLIQASENTGALNENEAKGLLNIIANYTQSFVLLNGFDSNRLPEQKLNEKITYEIRYPEAIAAIKELKDTLIHKKEASELFGNQKDNSFKGILGNIVQSFSNQYLYPSIEEQAAHLLYFVIKNHPFSDGNKRIGAFLFIWFLQKNRHHFKKSGELKINDNGLTALALLVAQSNADDKELMIKLIINLINAQ
ncbi:MAG TPA: virulence protein RhuM/Fic/DOC family protein [Bacteroidia bacterium]|jgi:death-on-curing family protein|nr:virulence protein RhuM/Fic/DOC family protein [Bacteroidia bacterium]